MADVINSLLTGGAPQQTQNNISSGIQALMSLLQQTPSPQTANAALGPSTVNVLNNAAQFTGNPAMAAGNYDATQNSGISQQQLAQTLQNLAGSGGISNQPNQGQGNVPALPQSAQSNAYQQGAQKALKEAGYAHAQQAVQAGIDPNQISNHPVMNNGQSQVNPQAIAVLQQLIQGNGQQQGQQAPQTQAPAQNQAPQQQKMPTGGIISRLLGMDLNPKGTGQRLQNMASLQELNAGQPSKIALPSAQAADLRAQAEMKNLQNTGNEPIQPKEYMSAYSGMYQKALDSYAKVSDSAKDIAASSQELFDKTSQNTRNEFQKWAGKPSNESAAALQSAIASQKAALDATHDFHQFLFKNNPGQVMSQIRQKVSGAADGGIKVGDKFNGENVVSVKRIK